MSLTIKPFVEFIQLTTSTAEKITRANLELLSHVSKAYLDACNACCKLYEDNITSTAKKA